MSHNDIHDRAVDLLRQYGDAAFLHAAMKADAAGERHDWDGQRLWTAITNEITRIEKIGTEATVQ